MPQMMPFSLPLTPSLLVPTLALVASALILQAESSPIFVQRRQSFFRCNGWGAGCYAFKPPSYSSRSETRSPVTRTAPKPKPSPPASAVHGGWAPHNYGLHYLFSSGHSWGANGKRQDPSLQKDRPLTMQELYDILNGISP